MPVFAPFEEIGLPSIGCCLKLPPPRRTQGKLGERVKITKSFHLLNFSEIIQSYLNHDHTKRCGIYRVLGMGASYDSCGYTARFLVWAGIPRRKHWLKPGRSGH
jgi:hypothetical protein